MIKAFGVIMTALFSSFCAGADLGEFYQNSQGGVFKSVGQKELAATEELFVRTFRNPADETLPFQWRSLGFQFQPIGGNKYYLVHELPDQKEGRGCYVFAPGAPKPLLVEAPHVPSDEKTGLICLELFESGMVRAASWNTVRRTSKVEGSEQWADLAHLPGTHFQAFSRAFVKEHRDGKVVQLHGFEVSKHKELSPHTAFIVSNGTAKPSLLHAQITLSLTELGLGPALLYPRDTRTLGGTRNVIGRSLRLAGSDGFVHLEMSRTSRTKLLGNRELQAEFLNAFKTP